MTGPRIAVVHDWLTGMRGGERVLEAILELLPPDVPIYTLWHFPGSVSPAIERHRIVTSPLQRLARKVDYRRLLPLVPWAALRLDVRGYDLVLSVSHCAAKAVGWRNPGQIRLCYLLTPMRYAYDRQADYLRGWRFGTGIAHFLACLRVWDRATTSLYGGPTALASISKFIRDRAWVAYGRSSRVIYPPVDTDRFSGPPWQGDYYLVVSALVAYKRVDLAVEACRRLERKLVVVGDGPEMPRLRALAGPRTSFMGAVDDGAVARWYAGCRAVLFPGVEDFGIVPVEAMASGKPVVAYAKGGAMETIGGSLRFGGVGVGGVLFDRQDAATLAAAIEIVEALRFEPEPLRAQAENFSKPLFLSRFSDWLSPYLGRVVEAPARSARG